MRKPRLGECGYCGTFTVLTKEHVFPSNLYPKSKDNSKVQRMTIRACDRCNNGWSDDEAHFRNVLAVSGDVTPVVRELWEDTILRSFRKDDGSKRVEDLFQQFVPTEVDGKDRHMIYPGNDRRVLQVVKKIVRGLLHHHGFPRAEHENIFADIQKYLLPAEMAEVLTRSQREADIVRYRFAPIEAAGILSVWRITFFNRTTFLAAVADPEFVEN